MATSAILEPGGAVPPAAPQPAGPRESYPLQHNDFGELPKARSFRIRKYGTDGTTIVRRPDGSCDVTDGAQSFTISNRDFNVLSIRSNLVLRWEWRPASTLFLVWQQDRFGDAGRGVGVGSLFDSFRNDGQQFLALKVSYWLAAR